MDNNPSAHDVALRCLGVNAAQGRLWLCLVHDDKPIETSPESMSLLEGQQAGYDLIAFQRECLRVLSRLSPGLVVILEPETTAKLSYRATRDRLAAETILALAAAEAGIECQRSARASLRSRLEVPRSGSLKDHVPSVVPQPVGKSWSGRRDLAALAAIAARKDS